MNFWESFELGIKNIFASKMRAFLTMLGIIIGVGAVIVIMGLGSGMEQYMSDQFASMGTNTLQVMVMGRGSSRSVSVDEMYALVEENPDTLSKISPLVELEGKVKIGTETDDTVSVGGVSEDYLAIKNFSMAQGRFLTYLDISQRTNACVLG
ncbi:MAG: ABC transporter permease, partial [Ruthenibacterium sp.]